MIVAVAYLRTGFDIINVPADPALLRSCASNTLQFPALDILNKRFLSSVRVKVDPAMYDESWIEQIDYIELKEENSNVDGIFYYVNSYSYTSRDVVQFSLVQDSILSCGGIKIIRTIYAKRAHIAKEADTFGSFDADDELLMPKEPLQLVHSGSTANIGSGLSVVGHHDGRTGLFFNFDEAGSSMPGEAQETVVLSTVGLAYEGTDQYMDYSAGLNTWGTWGVTDYSESAAGKDTRWPKLPKARGAKVHMPNVMRYVNNMAAVPPGTNEGILDYSGVEYNILGVANYHDSREAVNVLRSLGVEDSIIACYRLRKGEGTLIHEGESGVLPNNLYGNDYLYYTNGWSGGEGGLSSDSSRVMDHSQAYDYDFVPNQANGTSPAHVFNNLRVLYGEFRKYVISSPATGSSLEAKPEELTGRHFSFSGNYASDGGKNGSPYIYCFTDPRPTGRPYFNFVRFGQKQKTIGNQNAVVNLAEGAIAGGQWPEVPLVFTGMSGEWTARVGYNLDASYRDYLASPDKTYRDMVNGATLEELNAYNTVGAGAGVISSALQGGISGASVGGAVGAAGGAVMGAAGSAISSAMQVGTANAYYNQRLENAAIDVMRGYSSGQALVDAANAGNTAANRALERQYAASYEKAKFELSTAYTVPKAKFMGTDSMRDITENCAFYARYTPTYNDLVRMDNILQAFGYKVDMLMNNPIDNRTNFVYMEGSVEKFNDFIRVGNNNIPKVIRKDMMLDINNQLANGIRVWKVNPKNADVYNPG